jgi:hypothetical protein
MTGSPCGWRYCSSRSAGDACAIRNLGTTGTGTGDRAYRFAIALPLGSHPDPVHEPLEPGELAARPWIWIPCVV